MVGVEALRTCQQEICCNTPPSWSASRGVVEKNFAPRKFFSYPLPPPGVGREKTVALKL